MKHQLNLEQLTGRLLILETRRIEAPGSLSSDDWVEYHHLKRQYNYVQRQSRKNYAPTRIDFQRIRRYTDQRVLI